MVINLTRLRFAFEVLIITTLTVYKHCTNNNKKLDNTVAIDSLITFKRHTNHS